MCALGHDNDPPLFNLLAVALFLTFPVVSGYWSLTGTVPHWLCWTVFILLTLAKFWAVCDPHVERLRDNERWIAGLSFAAWLLCAWALVTSAPFAPVVSIVIALGLSFVVRLVCDWWVGTQERHSRERKPSLLPDDTPS